MMAGAGAATLGQGMEATVEDGRAIKWRDPASLTLCSCHTQVVPSYKPYVKE